VARREGRHFIGCEINTNTYKEHAPLVKAIPFVVKTEHEKPSTKPKNAGKKITEKTAKKIIARYDELHKTLSKKASMEILEKEFERGHFSLVNLLKKNLR